MTQVRIGDVRFEVSDRNASGEVVLSAEGRGRIVLLGNAPDGTVLTGGRIPADPTRAFLQRYLEREAQAIAEARAATAQQMWDEYANGWREAGGTDAANAVALGEALGAAEVSFSVGEDGEVSMADVQWQNRDLFLGHSVFTSVFDPHAWQRFDATLFG